MPAGEARCHIIAECERGVALDGDVVVVVEPDQVRQPKMASNRSSFIAHALHQISVPAERVDAVVEKIVAVFVVLRGQPALRDRHVCGSAACRNRAPRKERFGLKYSNFTLMIAAMRPSKLSAPASASSILGIIASMARS